MVKRKGLPELNELILCTVQRITPYAAWAKLEEYPGIEGMIHVSEVTGKWVHDIRDFVKANKQYVAKVVRLEPEKNFVNLSLKKVSDSEEKQKINLFRREQRAEKMLEQAGRELKKNLDQTYEEVGYLLQEKFGELFVAFEEAKKDKDELLRKGIPEKWVAVLAKIADEQILEKEIIIKAELNLKNFSSNGLEIIKECLQNLHKEKGAAIKYISAPQYRIELQG